MEQNNWADKFKCKTCYDTGIIPDSYPDQPCPDCKQKKEIQANFNFHNNGGDNGPTGHGDICHSDADSGL